MLERADFEVVPGTSGVMTMRGTVNKSALLLLITIVGAVYTWSAVRGGYASAGMGYAMIGAIAGFILALVTCFKQAWSPVTAPIYAICEGLFIGGISAMYEAKTGGITVQAVMLTFGTFAGMLFLFQGNILRATPMFMKVVIGATVGIMLTYLLGFILSFFHFSLRNSPLPSYLPLFLHPLSLSSFFLPFLTLLLSLLPSLLPPSPSLPSLLPFLPPCFFLFL